MRESTPRARRALLAASLGWMLDSFDVMLYALVLSALIHDLGLSKQQAGILGSITLIAAAFGGIFFGYIADRFGRVKALLFSVLTYAVFTAACGFARNIVELAVFRTLLGIGMGGEWASGASLVSESWPAKHRGKALGIVQSSWAIGYALAAVVAGTILPWKGWRAVFLVGVFPAILTLFLRRNVQESEAWKSSDRDRKEPDDVPGRRGVPALFKQGLGRLTIVITLMNACCLFAWWGFNLWVPAYLSLPVSEGGIGLTTRSMAGFVVAMQVGMWFGYVTFGWFSDRFGRKPCYVVYLVMAAASIVIYGQMRSQMILLLLGPILAFFATGYFTGFAAVTSELYPTRIRATALGFTYNVGRIASAAAPFLVGNMAKNKGFGAAFVMAGIAFLLAAGCWIWIPETRPSGKMTIASKMVWQEEL